MSSSLRYSRQSGFTLIELMVSLVIGFAVVGALLAAYMAAVRSTGHNEAMVQIAEDASQALNVIRSQVAMAGFSQPIVATTSDAGMTFHTFKTQPVFGCSQSDFGDLTKNVMASVACTGTTTSDTIEVSYEAVGGAGVPSNAILASDGTPYDCLGNKLVSAIDAGQQYYLDDSKFYVSNGSLYCYGSGVGAAGAPLVDNIEKMTITYGFAAPLATGSAASQIVSYGPAPALHASTWADVVSASICLQVRSARKVLDSNSAATLGGYVDCANTSQLNKDGYLRRTFSTTVVFQNKL